MRVQLPDGAIFGGAATDATAPLMIAAPRALLRRVGADGLIGFGESYMAGEWERRDLVGVLDRARRADGHASIPAPLQRLRGVYVAQQPAQRQEHRRNTRDNIARHYDLSNDLFALFLDATLTYSSALFDGRGSAAPSRARRTTSARPLRHLGAAADAQHRKIDRLLDLAGVGAGHRAAGDRHRLGRTGPARRRPRRPRRHRDPVEEQRAWPATRSRRPGHADRVDIELLRLPRRSRAQYDAVVSVEMIEAVGARVLADYFAHVDRLLAPGGRVALQAITMPHDRMLATTHTYTWIHKYIFPGGFLPSDRGDRARRPRAHRACGSASALTFGQHYAETLRLWRERFPDRADRVARARLRRDLPPHVALLPRLLRGRVPLRLPRRPAARCCHAGRPPMTTSSSRVAPRHAGPVPRSGIAPARSAPSPAASCRSGCAPGTAARPAPTTRPRRDAALPPRPAPAALAARRTRRGAGLHHR